MIPFSLFSLFCPSQLNGDFLPFGNLENVPPTFTRCSVRTVPRADVFLIYLWEKGAPHLDLIPQDIGVFRFLFSEWYYKPSRFDL